MSEAGVGSQEEPARVGVQGQRLRPRAAAGRSNSTPEARAATGNSNPTPKAKGGGREGQPHSPRSGGCAGTGGPRGAIPC